MKETHHDVIRSQFRQQAPQFGEQGLTLTNREYLHWMVTQLGPQPHLNVLDVAAGTGHLSRAMAPHVKRVVALDLTSEMLLQGRRAAEQDGLTNIVFEEGLAEALPHPNHAFDLVVSRFAVHHFQQPHIQIAEMARVCRPGGTVAVIDLVSPDDGALAETYNRLERLRDPSHTTALSARMLQGVMEGAGLNVVHTGSRDVEVNLNRWLDMTGTGADQRRTIFDALMQELQGLGTTGMRPFRSDAELLFLQRWVIIVGVKRREPRKDP